MRLAYFSQWSGPLYPDGLCWSSGCIVEAVWMFYAYKCRLTFLEAVRIWEARHVYSDGGDPDGNTCFMSPWGACSQEWGPYMGGPCLISQGQWLVFDIRDWKGIWLVVFNCKPKIKCRATTCSTGWKGI